MSALCAWKIFIADAEKHFEKRVEHNSCILLKGAKFLDECLYFRDDKTVRDNDGNPWRHGFLLERGKMTTDRFRKIKSTMMFGLNSSFSHTHSSSFINLNTFGNHTPIHVLGRVSRQERLAIGSSKVLLSKLREFHCTSLQNASNRDSKPRAKCFREENASKRRMGIGRSYDATATTR